MPPHVPRKRLAEVSSETEGSSKKKVKSEVRTATVQRKGHLYDDLDTVTPRSNSFLDSLNDNDAESSLSSLSDEDFEDVTPPQKQTSQGSDDKSVRDSEEDSDDDIEFEDVAAPSTCLPDAPVSGEALELTLVRDTRVSLTNPFGEKKGPSKRERRVRYATHSVHVLLLLWHNAIRNSWLCDMEVQAIMISHLPPRVWDEVDRWRRASGLEEVPMSPKDKRKGNRTGKEKEKMAPKGKSGGRKGKAKEQTESRDWGDAADKLEHGAIDMSHGDPLFRLMKCLTSWWRQRFRITASGLRKWGYMSLERLDKLTKEHKTDDDNCDKYGENIGSLEAFRTCATLGEGSRDVGAQLFTALLRGLGIEARMVANLQTLGFGWNKLEDAEPEKEDKNNMQTSEGNGADTSTKIADSKPETVTKTVRSSKTRTNKDTKKKNQPCMEIEDSEEDEKLELEYKDTDDESLIEVEVRPKKTTKTTKKFDSDLEYPHYWTEVLSPVTKKYLPVDVMVKNIIATNRDLTEALEPRGLKADKARQTMAYIVGYSPDGTAKDVTVRYLKKQVLPGRTRGARIPLEKVPIYNRHGKVKGHEQFDWFKTAISGYKRGSINAPITEIDDEEDSTDLKPKVAEKKEMKEGEETLQYYKQSKDFCLARHLKREEALKPGAKAVKVFKNKGKAGKAEEEDVFLRADVLKVKSAETWHKEGRAPIAGEQPLKRVPYRAATTNRRRELAEVEAATGQKALQGLYSWDQTEWIIPPPIENGVIPKNEYGNIDLFVEHMCPQGAVHVPYRGSMKVCKRLKIDYAEAVVDFEFGHRMAVPVIRGVVIAEEYHDKVMEELEKDEAERLRKEDEKRRKTALGKWRKFLMGLRIVERIRQDYGDIDDSVSVFAHSKVGSLAREATKKKEEKMEQRDEDMAGGFLPEGYEEEEEVEDDRHHGAGFFPTALGDDEDHEDDLVIEHDRRNSAKRAPRELAPVTESGEEEDIGLLATDEANTSMCETSNFFPSTTASQSERGPGRNNLDKTEQTDEDRADKVSSSAKRGTKKKNVASKPATSQPTRRSARKR